MVQASLSSIEPLAMSPASGPEPARGPRYHLAFHGTGEAFFVLILKNVLLTLVTLGVYAAWATTAKRKYIWQNVEFHGQRLIWHGTGMELFKGYLKVGLAYLLLLGGMRALSHLPPTVATLASLGAALGVVALVPYAVYWSRAYLLSRTTWRGVRFAMEPGAGPFVRAFIGGYLLSLLTLGLYAPVWLNRVRAITTNRTRFGTQAFRYDGSSREVWKISMRGLVLSVLTLGIYSFWYQAELARYQMAHTHFQGARGRLDLGGWDLLKLSFVYVLGTTLSLGLGFPWLATYAAKFFLDRLSFEGAIDFASVGQSETHGNAAGDALADGLDAGLGL